MAVAPYSPLAREEVQDESADPLTQHNSEPHETARSATSSARSAKYYGETDNPASEDEDEALLDKIVPTTPALAELGDMHEDGDDLDVIPQVSRSLGRLPSP
jgi:hypothetical protein